MELNADPESLCDAFRWATPFPYVVLDGLFPDEAVSLDHDRSARPQEEKSAPHDTLFQEPSGPAS